MGDTRRAIEFHQQALTIARDIGDKRGEDEWLGALGNCYSALGDTRRAIEFYEQALAIARDIGDKRGEGNWLGNLGNCYRALGDTHRAIEFHQQALTIARDIGDKRGEGYILRNIALILLIQGSQDEQAQRNLNEALHILEQIGDQRGIALCLMTQGMLAYVQNSDEEANEFYQKAQVIATEIGARPIVAVIRLFRSPLEGTRLGKEEAIKLATEAKAAFAEMGMNVVDEDRYREMIEMFTAGQFPK